MEIDAIVWALEKLGSVSLYRTPKDLQALGEPWFSEFRNIPEKQFKQIINEIIKIETSWPAISTIHKYISDQEKSRKKVTCSYCEDTGFLLIKSKNKDIAYACKCEEGRKKRKNLGIMAYESLGIPWPVIEKPDFFKKMSTKNRQLIDDFLGRIGQEMPEEGILEEELLWGMMIDGSLGQLTG